MSQIYKYIIFSGGIFLCFTLLLFLIRFFIKRLEKISRIKIKGILKKRITVPLLLLGLIFSITAPSDFLNINPETIAPLKKVMVIAIILFITWIVLAAVSLGSYFIKNRYNINSSNNLKARKSLTQIRIIERVIFFIVIIISISLILMSFEEIKQIGVSLIASAGVAGVIIGFAAQKVIGSLLAGVQIAIAQPIRIDDVVIVENEWGRIEELNLTYVVVRIWDKRRLVLPTTYFIEKPFQNWTRNSSEILGTVYIYTDYKFPVKALREELDIILKGTELWDGKVSVVQVTASTEKSMEIRVLISAVDSPIAWDLRVYVREKLIEFLQQKYPDNLPKSRVVLDKK